MPKFLGNPDVRHDQPAPTGVLLTNLGTPDAPTFRALRRYLKEFLSDPRVVEVPRPLWWLILNGIILNIRPGRSARAYRTVWTDAGSPLLRYSRAVAGQLEAALVSRAGAPVRLALGMRYGRPSIASALDELRRAGVDRLVVLPLYPQYSATTTGSTMDAVGAALRHWRRVPALRFIDGYHDDDGYIAAVAESIARHREREGAGEKLLFSFHGLPERYFRAGDPYFCLCHKTARLVAERLGLGEGDWQVVFQSRFGREPWLKPYADETLQRLAHEGLRSVDVVCPGFAVDCLETLEEIAMQNRDLFLNAGGERFGYIPCLNDSPAHIAALADRVAAEAGDWLAAAPSDESLQARRARARALGADA